LKAALYNNQKISGGAYMIIWLNGAFGSGKTSCAYELKRRIPNSFVYDPEKIGYFIRKNVPEEMQKTDFQDHEQWRMFNYSILKDIYLNYSGTIIVPMTIVNPQYYDEIIQRLIDEGVILKHFILYANRATLLKRLNRRIERGDTWAKRNIDRCINAFDNYITEMKIMTDDKSIDDVVEEIAEKSGLTLLPDKRGRIKKEIDRAITLLKHIR